MWAKQKQTGFTIVELLIVIVVIAILAAIVIVAYTGIQQRARNSAIISGVDAYRKALLEYSVEHQSYPLASGSACLGAGYPGNQCWNGINGNGYVDAGVDAALATYFNNGNKLTVSTNMLQITTAPDYRAGALLVTSPYRIIYYLEGAGQTCIDGSSGTTEMQGTQCALTLPTP